MLLTALITASTSQAASVFELFFSVNGQEGLDSTFVEPAGAVLPSEIIFRETVTDGTGQITIPGIGFVNANITAVGGDGSFSTPQVSSALTPIGTADADTLAGSGFFSGVNPVETSPGVFDAVVGTIDLTAPTFGSTTFTLSDFGGGNDFEIVGGGGIDDADVIFRSVTVTTTTAVPEPNSMAALAMLGGTIAIRYRRRRKTAA